MIKIYVTKKLRPKQVLVQSIKRIGNLQFSLTDLMSLRYSMTRENIRKLILINSWTNKRPDLSLKNKQETRSFVEKWRHKCHNCRTTTRLCYFSRKKKVDNFKPLSANPTKSIKRQLPSLFVSLREMTYCLSVFDHFVRLVLKGLSQIACVK